MLTLHKLLLNGDNPTSFDAIISPTEQQRLVLVAAKNDIRARLTSKIRAATTEVLGMGRMVSPRFRTQGSWAYRTCVQGAHVPPQEMDWDFGVYLPVTVWTQQDPPPRMAKLYFDLVEGALAELCDEKGWHLDRTNANCVRVRIASWAHIDVPLYAAPESEFIEVMEKATASPKLGQFLRESVALDESAEFGEMPEAFWEEMEGIHMATRDGTWRPSDPEAVSNWFSDRVEEHREQLRRVCRYLKAWRDFHWPEGKGPSSVLIMILVARRFSPVFRRDDIALEQAARSLADGVRGDVFEDAIDFGAENFNRLDQDQRQLAADRADTLVRKLNASRHYGPGLIQAAIDNVREQFGDRIPNDRGLVQVDDGSDVVRNTAAVSVSAPVVGATHAG